jgi:DNA-binding CsgD family transcriptional regulator
LALVNALATAQVIDLEGARRARGLSRRERAVLGQLAQGRATEEIAQTLVLSPHTVRSHVKAAMNKLGAHTRAHAVAIALTAGAIEGPA